VGAEIGQQCCGSSS